MPAGNICRSESDQIQRYPARRKRKAAYGWIVSARTATHLILPVIPNATYKITERFFKHFSRHHYLTGHQVPRRTNCKSYFLSIGDAPQQQARCGNAPTARQHYRFSVPAKPSAAERQHFSPDRDQNVQTFLAKDTVCELSEVAGPATATYQ